LAIASLILGLLSIFCFVWPLFGLPAIIFGIIALVKISHQKPYLKGTGMAVTGIVVPTVMLLLLPILLAVLMPALGKVKEYAQSIVCQTNLQGLSAAMAVYVNDHGKFPPENWCDLLILEDDVSPKSLVCPASGDIEGECSYAMNKNIAGVSGDVVPELMVVFFETNIGLEDGPRNTPIQSRRHYDYLNEGSGGWYPENLQVYRNRWNQYGGPDDLLLSHDREGRSGCNVVFGDGHAEFVTADRLPSLQWTTNSKVH
jgi:prepilin-type processing-associated H-X9-DG protein